MQQKLDGLRDAYSGPYDVGGKQVTARPMFHMLLGANATSAAQHHGELVRALEKKGYGEKAAEALADAATSGCASPEQIVKATQALIDAGYLPEGEDVDRCIRDMQWTFGIGIDCAGFTYRALMATTGCKDYAFGLNGIGGEGFRALDGNAHFAKKRPADVRPGDIITLDGPGGATGHNVMVRSHTVVSDAEQRALEKKHGDTARQFFAGTGPFHAIQVDSSWGTGYHAEDYGGHRSDTWLYDEGSKKWASVNPATGKLVVSDVGPSGDIFHGAYRVKGGA